MCFRINNFLCCLSLRTGGLEVKFSLLPNFKIKFAGLVIGWVALIFNLIATIIFTLGIVAGLILTCQDFAELFREHSNQIFDDFDEQCDLYKGGNGVQSWVTFEIIF